ncbi:MAG TPA: hypothetical protein VM097_09955 [Mycobacteriales bacterium]|nr:hypothetical protein [Mycobacteriales bacterium]
MRRASVSALAPLVAVALLTACGGSPRAVAPAGSAARHVEVTTTRPPSALPSAAPEPETPLPPDEVAEERSDLLLDEYSQGLPVLTRIWMAEAPRGTVSELALRFMQALQRGDDFAADRDLHHFDRFLFSERPEVLHAAMDDVRRHAGLPGAGRCVRAMRLAHGTAVVLCGATRVVVHVAVGEDERGVKINEQHARRDVFRGPHRHAVTSLFRPEL